MSFNPPDYYGVKKEEKDKLKEWDRYESNHIRIYPNATIEEVRKNAKEVKMDAPFRKDQKMKRYKKGKFGYLIDNSDVIATYLPSLGKELKIMFEWNDKKKEWILLTYKEGNW